MTKNNKIIRVLHTEWSGGWGGQEIRIINEMLAVRERGIEVFLAAPAHAEITKKAHENNIAVFELPFKGKYDLKTFWLLRKIIREHEIDIVNTHSGGDTWVGGLAAKTSGAKFIRTRHLGYRIKSSYINFINQLADYVITTGSNVRDEMIKFNRIKPHKIISIPTCTNTEIYNPQRYDKICLREKFGLKDKQTIIGTLCFLRGVKRLDLFIKMASAIIHKNPDIYFVIAGEGPQKNNCIGLINSLGIEKNVKMLGHVDKPWEFFASLDLFVITSDAETGPQTAMQALLMEVPLISTDVGSVKDFVIGSEAVIVPCNHLQALIFSVEDFLTKKRNNQLPLISRDYLVKNYSFESMINKILKVYYEVL